MASPRNFQKTKEKTSKPGGSSAGESFMQSMMGRIVDAANSIGAQALDDLKLGVGRGWLELKSGIDTGIDSATDGMKNAWREFSGGIDRAMEGYLPKQDGRSENKRQ